MWNKIYEGIFYNQLAINEVDVEYLINKIKNHISYEITDSDFDDIINKTKYRFQRSKYLIHEDLYAMTIIEHLLNKAFAYTNMKFNKHSITRSFQLTTKYFDNNSSYGLHFEDPTYFGDYFFVLYLDECEGGELVFPDLDHIEDLFARNVEDKNEWQKGIDHLKLGGNLPLIVEKTIKVQPKRNTAILGKIPYAHYVNKIKSTNSRIVVNGFPFAK
jgi:hypothetical protein